MRLPDPPSFRLDGKKAVVLGAGKGIGMASAAALAQAGADVLAVSRTRSDLQKLREGLREQGLDCRTEVMDLTDLPGLRSFFSREPLYDVNVVSAGTNVPQPAFEVEEATFDRVFELNVKAAFFASVAWAKSLVGGKKTGSLILLSSQMGRVGSPDRSVYCASKHALEGFVKSFAWEWGASGIRVNAVCPTFVETPMTAPFLENDDFKRRVLDNIALRRLGQPEDVTGAVLFLASEASALVTGSSLLVDGGWTAR